MDLIEANNYFRKIVWHENNGQGDFLRSYDLATTASRPLFVSGDDLDGDQDLDLVVLQVSGENNLILLKNDGTQVFSSTVLGTFRNAYGLALVDIDKDGDLDIWTQRCCDWLQNDGGASFQLQTFTNADGLTLSLSGDFNAIEDLDQDGDMDIVGPDYWFRNNGAFNFSQISLGSNLTTVSRPLDFQVRDVDLDGDFDVVFTNDSVQWLQNDGKQNFSNTSLVTSKQRRNAFS